MQPATPSPEADRDRPQPRAGRHPARTHCRRGRCARQRGGLLRYRHVRVSGGRRHHTARHVLLHGSQPARAGRAHRHRDGDRRRSGGDAVGAGAGGVTGRAGACRADHASRSCNPSAYQCGNARCIGPTASLHRHAHRVRAAQWPRRACRHLRLRGLPPQPALRFAAGQADRARAARHLCASAGADVPRAVRIPYRRTGDQQAPAAGLANRCRGASQRRAHAVS